MNASAMTNAPTTIDHFVGAREIKERVRVAIEATWNSGNGCVFPHTLALGSPGLGKTELSRIIAREMGCELVETLGQSIRTTAELYATLLMAEGGCVLIDEAHALSGDIQVSLLKVLQEGMIFLPQAGCSDRIKPIQLKPLCLIAATTDEWALARPLVERFRLLLRFDFYGIEDLTTLVARRARSASIVLDNGVAEQIAQRAKGTPRLGIRLLDACCRTMQAEATGTVSLATFERTCQLEQIDSLGLDMVEQRYLHLLGEAGGRQRVNVIASCLGLPRQTLERAIEPFLIRARLVEKTEQGRILTAIGRQHLNSGMGQTSPIPKRRDFETPTPSASMKADVPEGEHPCQ
ncbi:MAG: Holliday junction DNA helicase RuvB C-terminal domain-containing protein [Tepidisphaeraceae bacterium]|jgi:Holliday junction DNA helicase RuvB